MLTVTGQSGFDRYPAGRRFPTSRLWHATLLSRQLLHHSGDCFQKLPSSVYTHSPKPQVWRCRGGVDRTQESAGRLHTLEIGRNRSRSESAHTMNSRLNVTHWSNCIFVYERWYIRAAEAHLSFPFSHRTYCSTLLTSRRDTPSKHLPRVYKDGLRLRQKTTAHNRNRSHRSRNRLLYLKSKTNHHGLSADASRPYTLHAQEHAILEAVKSQRGGASQPRHETNHL